MTKPESIDQYIDTLPPERQALARDIRAAIQAAVPEAEGVISYAIPCFILAPKRRIYFALWKAHVGLYPIYVLPPELEARVAPYRAKTDTLQFKYKDAVPLDLIADLARFKAKG